MERCFYQNIQCIREKNQDLLKNKKWLNNYYQGLLSNLDIKIPLSKIPLLADILLSKNIKVFW